MVVVFSCSVMSYSLRSHGLQHARLSCPSLSPRVCSNSCPLSQWCHPTISSSVVPSPPAFSLSQHQSFSSESAFHIRCAKYWSFSFSISPSNEYSGLISFRMDRLNLLAKDSQDSSPTPQFKSINSSMISFFMVQLSHPYMTTGKTIALTRRTFVSKVVSLLFNTLSRLS